MVKEWFYSDLVATEWDPITLYPIYNGTATKVMKKRLFLQNNYNSSRSIQIHKRSIPHHSTGFSGCNPRGVHPSSNGMSRLIACQSKRTTSISLTMAPCSAYQCNGPHYSNPRSSSTNGRNSRAISQRLAVPNHWSMVEHHRLCFSWYFILTVIKRPFVWPYSDGATPFGLQSDPRKIAITPNNN